MSKSDIVAEFVALAREVAGVDPQAAKRLSAGLRHAYGGQKVIILPREPITLEQIDVGLRQGKPVRTIAGELGCSRATIYRHLSAKVTRKRRIETA